MIKQQIRDNWIVLPQPNPQATLRLFCFPYAGGGASIYRNWAQLLPNSVELVAVQLPGREDRLAAAPMPNMTQLVQVLTQELRPYLNKPFVLFGHSMGAIICFELARQLRRIHAPQPVHLFVSAHKAPHLPRSGSTIHHLPDSEFIQEIRLLEGTPEAILANEELMQLLLPTLRADFELIETYRYVEERPLDTQLTAFGGTQDKDITHHHLLAWRKQTSHHFALRMFPSNHFFIHHEQTALIQALKLFIEAISCNALSNSSRDTIAFARK